LTKQSDKIAALEFQNEQLRNRIAALEARVPPEPKPLMLEDLKVVGHRRPDLPKPNEDWMPSDSELKQLGRLVHQRFPYLVDFNQNWLRQFRLAFLALGYFCRTERPNKDSWGSWVGQWLEDRRFGSDGIGRGPFLAAVAASGDIPFSGFDERDALRGILPMAGIAAHGGVAADRSAWKRVLSSGKLTGENAAAQVNQGRPDRWDNPRSRVELLPQYDRR